TAKRKSFRCLLQIHSSALRNSRGVDDYEFEKHLRPRRIDCRIHRFCGSRHERAASFRKYSRHHGFMGARARSFHSSAISAAAESAVFERVAGEETRDT